MAAATRAEFTELNPAGIVPPIFFRDVVTLLTLCTLERNMGANCLLGHDNPLPGGAHGIHALPINFLTNVNLKSQ